MHNTGIRIYAVAGMLAFALVASACAASANTGVGAQRIASTEAGLAPQLSVPTATGETFSLAEHQATDGRPVFLNLWASWCFPCREEMPALNAASETFTNIKFVGVAIQDTREDAEAFVEEIGVTYTIGFDMDNAVNVAYDPLGIPASYLISGDGVILERIFGKVTEKDLEELFARYFE